MVEISEEKALRIRDGCQSLATALNAVVKAVQRHNATCATPAVLPPIPSEAICQLFELIRDDLRGGDASGGRDAENAR